MSSVVQAANLTSNSSSVQVTCEGVNGVGVDLTSNAWNGTVSFQASYDGVTWRTAAAFAMSNGVPMQSVTSTTAEGRFIIPTMGMQYVRVLVTVYTSGQMMAVLEPSDSAFPGVTPVNHEGQKATYSYAINAHAPAATPTDWLTILGSASKTVKLVRLRIRCRATAGAQYRVALRKYSTVYTVGTPAAVTAVPHDANDPAATAVVQTWSGGLPTIGTPVGSITDDSYPCAVLGTPGWAWVDVLNFGSDGPQRAPTLRGVGQYLALWSNAVALPGGFVADVNLTITEE